jgi:hypothetical protein
VFVPSNNEVSSIIDLVATRQFGLERARTEFHTALRAIEDFGHRGPIETAHNHVRAVAEEAYFYAGVAFGVCLGVR